MCHFPESEGSVCRMSGTGGAAAPVRSAREFSETPKARAFWRVAPTVLLSALAIFGAGVLLRAIVFNSFTSLLVHSRRFAFLAMVPLSIRVQRTSRLTQTALM